LKIKSFLEQSSETKEDDTNDDYVYVSAESIKNFLYGFESCTADVTKNISNITDIKNFTNFIKYVSIFYFIGLCGQVLSFKTLIWLSLNGLIAVGFLLTNKAASETVKPLVAMATGQTTQLYQSIIKKIPKYAPVSK